MRLAALPLLAGCHATPDFPVEKQREMIHAAKMLRAEDIAAAAHFFLCQPRRTLISLMRVEPRIAE